MVNITQRSQINIIFKIFILIVIIVPKKSFSNITSVDYHFNEPKFKCSRMVDEIFLTVGNAFLYLKKSENIKIHCFKFDALHFDTTQAKELCANSLFDNVTFVPEVEIIDCSLPTGRSIKSYLNIFGVSGMNYLSIYTRTNQSMYVNREHLFGLEDLKEMYVSKVQLSEDLFEDVRNLKTLKLKTIIFPKYIFTNLETLESLQIIYNSLQQLEKEMFKNQRRLKNIDLSSNNLLDLKKEDFKDLLSLEELNLPDNGIKKISSNVFSSVTSLKRLDLSYNNIESVPEQLFKNNIELEILRLIGTFDRETTLPEKLFVNQTNLRVLLFKNNFFNNLPDGLFNKTYNLRLLDLSFNQLYNISG